MPTLLLLAAAATITTGIDEQAQLPYWQVAGEGVSMRLVQRLPDQTRGYFQARGFKVEDSERIAQACIFQTVFKNISADTSRPEVVRYNLRDWVIHVDGRSQGLKTREDWLPEWETRGVSPAARIAFEWSLLPTRQVYQPQDYNWGMSAFNLPPGTRFDLDVVWSLGKQTFRQRIRNIQCAPDEHRDPGTPG